MILDQRGAFEEILSGIAFVKILPVVAWEVGVSNSLSKYECRIKSASDAKRGVQFYSYHLLEVLSHYFLVISSVQISEYHVMDEPTIWAGRRFRLAAKTVPQNSLL